MLPKELQSLPIVEVFDDLRDALSRSDNVVLEAPPGAGKTTAVPLALLNEPWLAGRKILMLEPRRMAARAAASRMAGLLYEEPGDTVGYRIRLDSCVGELTRVEVVTEGVLARRLQMDPALSDVGLVIFDEFHERNLDSDLGLALTLQGREMFREAGALKVLVMSATLDGGAISGLLGGAPLIRSDGRQYPVDVHFSHPLNPRDPLMPPLMAAVKRALTETAGSVLVFLPGQREINSAARELGDIVAGGGYGKVVLSPLYGGLSLEQQQRAIRPAPEGSRKIVLATNIAETSLTIDGISAVVDSGLAREAVYDANTGMTRLSTRRISRASARQRKGRAGRLGRGDCYRLWSEEQHQQLVAHGTPEILQADLTPLAMQLLAWGIEDPSELHWLNPPPVAPYQKALDTLALCDAAFKGGSDRWQLSPHGVRLTQLPLHPRLAHMLMKGCDIGAAETACLLAAVLAERNPVSGRGTDIGIALSLLMGETSCPEPLKGWYKRCWQQARKYSQVASAVHMSGGASVGVPQREVPGVLLASAYPDRLARLRPGGDGRQYILSSGRAAELPPDDALTGTPWLAVAESGGEKGRPVDRIYSAAPLAAQRFSDVLASLVQNEERAAWDDQAGQFVCEQRSVIGQIQLSVKPLENIPDSVRNDALVSVVRARGLNILPWTDALVQWRRRVMLMHDLRWGDGENPWPDLSDANLLASLEEWLAPYLQGVTRLEDFKRLDLRSIMHAQLPWPLPLELERLAPERIAVPSGSNPAIDYAQEPPVLAIKLQEMFGCDETPRIADGALPLQVHLLSPAGRPLQVTQDLATFWRDGYQSVRKEMRGRYPKHPWPEDPTIATPTAKTNRALRNS